MGKIKKTWFLCRDFDWPAENGPAKLGSIIVNPESPPVLAINSEPFDLPHEPYEREQLKWEDNRDKHWSGSVTIFAEFLNVVGLGPDISGGRESKNDDCFKCDKMLTKYVQLENENEYIHKRMKDEKVQKWIKGNPGKKKVFIITGLKIAYNPQARYMVSHDISGKVKLGVDLTALAVPATVGPKVEGTYGQGKTRGYEGGTDIVYAFQMMEIWYDVKSNNEVRKTKRRTRGAYMRIDRSPEEEDEDEQVSGDAGRSVSSDVKTWYNGEEYGTSEATPTADQEHEEKKVEVKTIEVHGLVPGNVTAATFKMGMVTKNVKDDVPPSSQDQEQDKEDEEDEEDVDCVLPPVQEII
jgi:hypothetical protein